MSPRPSLLDNLEGSHAAGLVALAEDQDRKHPLAVATGYVNLGGLHHLAVSVSEGRATRLLLGATPSEALGNEIPASLFLRTMAALSKERDLSRFPESRALKTLQGIRDWLERDDVEVRRYVAKFLHGKAYLFGSRDDPRAAMVTSANLTAAGMWHNLELGLVDYNPPVAEAAVAWFDGLWDEASDYKDDLRDLLFPNVELLDPRTVYLRALLDLFGDQADERDVDPPSAVTLAPFQEDGFQRATGIVERHRGVVFADGVGTGKTEIGLAFVERYVVRRGLHALVVVPAQLRRQWRDRLAQTRLSAQVISYHDLAADQQLAANGGAKRVLSIAKDAYRLVVFDEAHTLRNPDTQWYRAMLRLLGGVRKDVVLLTATPINNGLWDLYHMVMAFARHDRAFAAHGVPSLRELFEKAGANERNPADLNPDVLFPLADMVSVRRDRRFIETNYPGATFPDGTKVAFPKPTLETRRYDFDKAHPGLVQEIAELVGRLSMARYRPSEYRVEGAGEQRREVTLSALLQSGILKRLESCWHACLRTVQRIEIAHGAFLEAWGRGRVLSGDALREAAKTELDESGMSQWLDEALEDGVDSEPCAAYVPGYRRAVAADLERLTRARALLEKLSPEADPKLALLEKLIRDSPSRKVIVFSAFADTVRYLDENLPKEIGGRERVAVIGADTTPDQRTAELSRFCPRTVIGPEHQPPAGEVDLLLSNDVLSEGQNLQQAGAVVSYDMPWNPQRMVQRYGRVVRLKSPHETVRLTTMLPSAGDLDEILNLELVVRRKIAAASPYGMDLEVIDEAEIETRTYAERLQGGDETILDEHRPGDDAEFSGEALRAELRRELAEGRGEELSGLPWGIGAAFRQGPDVPSTGRPGVFFACRADGRRHWRYVEADSGEDGDGRAGELRKETASGVTSEPAEILRRIRPGDAPGVASPEIDLEAAWRVAAASIVEAHNEEVERGASASLSESQRWARRVLVDPAVGRSRGAREAYDALQVGRDRIVRRELTRIRKSCTAGEMSRAEAARAIVGVVEAQGLGPIDPEPEGRTIAEDDVGVVCWMGVLAPGPRASRRSSSRG